MLMMQGKKLGRSENINQQEEIKKDLKALYKDENECKEKTVTKSDGRKVLDKLQEKPTVECRGGHCQV